MFRRDLCLIVAALDQYPGHRHLARDGRFVDRRHRHSGQDVATTRRGRIFLKFSFLQRDAKICEKKHRSFFEAVATGHK